MLLFMLMDSIESISAIKRPYFLNLFQNKGNNTLLHYITDFIGYTEIDIKNRRVQKINRIRMQ